MKKILVIGLSGESVFLQVDRLVNDGQTLTSPPRHVEPGGKGYNQAIALGALGADVEFITTFGTTYREECQRTLIDNKVNILEVTKDAKGSYAVIIVDKEGNNKVIVDGGASALVTYDDIIKYQKQIDKADIILLQLEYNQEAIKKVIDYAYEKGKMIILNPAPKCTLDKETLAKVTYLTPNEYEVTLLPDVKTKIIITLGSKGVCFNDFGKEKYYEAYKTKALDTTGAGDVFNAAFAFAKSIDYQDEEAIKFAICASSYKVERQGIINALPTYDDVKKRLGRK